MELVEMAAQQKHDRPGHIFNMKITWLPISLRGRLRCACSPRQTPSIPLRSRVLLNASSKHFSTSSQLRAGIAAPEIKFDDSATGAAGGREEATFCARLVPDSPSYFTGQPIFIDDLL